MKKLITLLFLSSCVFASSPESVIKNASPKVVKIGIVMPNKRGVCSGAFISSTGEVLTCAHCFREKDIKKIFIKTEDGTVYKAARLEIDNEKDLAIVVPDSVGPFPFFKMGKMPVRGQEVISLGSPLGLQHTATVGYVNNIVRSIYTFVFHSAFINPGNSGGPLVNMRGEIVGVNEATISYGIFSEAQGLFVAISIDTIQQFLKERMQ